MTTWYFNVWWLAIPLLAWHCYHYRAYEIVLVGLAIDVQFMYHVGIPWYTLGALLTLVCAELLKPMLRQQGTRFNI